MPRFSSDELKRFLAGEIIYCKGSSAVEWARYDAEFSILNIQFTSGGKVYAYPNASKSMAIDFAQADSKGTWVDQNGGRIAVMGKAFNRQQSRPKATAGTTKPSNKKWWRFW